MRLFLYKCEALILMVTNNQLCAALCCVLLVGYMVKSVLSSVFLSALLRAYITVFNFQFIKTSFRASFHYLVLLNTS